MGTQPIFIKPTNAGLNALFAAMAKATISGVRLTKDSQVVLSLSNGKSKFYPLGYIKSLLIGNFLEEARPTILIGATVTYTEHPFKVGDKCVDDKGVVSLTAVHKTEGVKLINFEFNMDTVGSTISEYDKARMNANAVANAMVKVQGSFAKAATKQIAEPAAEPADAETSAVLADGEDEGEDTI